MQSTRFGNDFNNLTSIGDDRCEANARDRENEQIMNYILDRAPMSSNSALNDIGVYPKVSDVRFSHDNLPRPGDTSKASRLLQSRPFATMPFMGAGRTSIVNPDIDTALTRGRMSTTKAQYNPAPLQSRTYRPMPMLPGIQREIQNTDHLIPSAWVRGGLSTRGQIRNANYGKERCIRRN